MTCGTDSVEKWHYAVFILDNQRPSSPVFVVQLRWPRCFFMLVIRKLPRMAWALGIGLVHIWITSHITMLIITNNIDKSMVAMQPYGVYYYILYDIYIYSICLHVAQCIQRRDEGSDPVSSPSVWLSPHVSPHVASSWLCTWSVAASDKQSNQIRATSFLLPSSFWSSMHGKL